VPDDDTRMKLLHSGISRLTGTFRVCVDDQGKVESVLPLRSTGSARYDRPLIGAMQQWASAPLVIDDQPVPFCAGVTFIYTQR
jgi:outer membrane biosynthesis protein TonB